MPRLSIKTKLSAVISILVLVFGLVNLVFFPAAVKRQFQAQAETSIHQVAETASYALAPAMESRNRAEVARILEGVKNIPTFSFSAVFDEAGTAVDASPSAPSPASPSGTGSRAPAVLSAGDSAVNLAAAAKSAVKRPPLSRVLRKNSQVEG